MELPSRRAGGAFGHPGRGVLLRIIVIQKLRLRGGYGVIGTEGMRTLCRKIGKANARQSSDAGRLLENHSLNLFQVFQTGTGNGAFLDRVVRFGGNVEVQSETD